LTRNLFPSTKFQEQELHWRPPREDNYVFATFASFREGRKDAEATSYTKIARLFFPQSNQQLSSEKDEKQVSAHDYILRVLPNSKEEEA
jgi:hypothetical protein